MATTAPAWLTKKLGPLPVWGWGVIATGTAGLIYWARHRSSGTSSASSAATPATPATPVDLGSQGAGGSFGGGGGGSASPGAPVSGPATGGGVLQSIASALGFTNPNTPVQLVGGNLIDTGTGREAYYGPNGQPGSASPFAGAISWTDPTGKTVYFNPNQYSYADTSRAPDLPPSLGMTGSTGGAAALPPTGTASASVASAGSPAGYAQPLISGLSQPTASVAPTPAPAPPTSSTYGPTIEKVA